MGVKSLSFRPLSLRHRFDQIRDSFANRLHVEGWRQDVIIEAPR